MTRALIPIATLAAVYLLGNALAAGDWSVAFPLGVVVFGGIYVLARNAAPGVSTAAAEPSTRSVAAEAEQPGATQ